MSYISALAVFVSCPSLELTVSRWSWSG